MDLTRWSGEPSILAMADGTLLITGAGGLTRFVEDPSAIPGNFGQSYVWRSVDDGASWEFVDLGLPEPVSALAPYRNAMLGVEGDLAEDEAGRAYFVDLAALASNVLSVSDDAGASWTAVQNPLVGQPGVDRPWVAAMGDGVVYVKYLATASGHRVARSTDAGLTFLEDVALPSCGQGAIVADLASREVVVPCQSGATLSMLRTAEGEMAWERIDVLEADGPAGNVFVSMAVAGPREYVFLWSESLDGFARVRAVASVDGGASWGEPVTLSSDNRTAVFPWIDANPDGIVGAVFYEADAPGESATMDASWRAKHASLRLLADGSLALGEVVDLSSEPVHEGAICTSGLGCVLSGNSEDRRLLDFFEVDVDAAGRSHVTWTSTLTDVPTVWYGQVAPKDADVDAATANA